MYLQTDNWYRIVKVFGQGYGTMSPEAWAATPESLGDAIHVETPAVLYTLADILSRLPPDRARAEIWALDWCCENYVIPNTRAPVSVR